MSGPNSVVCNIFLWYQGEKVFDEGGYRFDQKFIHPVLYVNKDPMLFRPFYPFLKISKYLLGVRSRCLRRGSV